MYRERNENENLSQNLNFEHRKNQTEMVWICQQNVRKKNQYHKKFWKQTIWEKKQKMITYNLDGNSNKVWKE